MFTCLENWKCDLVELTESEFLAFLDHAENCRYHAKILEKYESEMVPLVKLAYSDIFLEPVVTIPGRNYQSFWKMILNYSSYLKSFLYDFLINFLNLKVQNSLFFQGSLSTFLAVISILLFIYIGYLSYFGNQLSKMHESKTFITRNSIKG